MARTSGRDKTNLELAASVRIQHVRCENEHQMAAASPLVRAVQASCGDAYVCDMKTTNQSGVKGRQPLRGWLQGRARAGPSPGWVLGAEPLDKSALTLQLQSLFSAVFFP